MKIRCGIYKITSPTGRVYIGQTHDMQSRILCYKSLKGRYSIKLNRSILKYGWDSHSFKVIHELPLDVDQSVIDTYEILYISQYKSLGVELLNIMEGGRGGKHSEETKIKISTAMKGREISQETREKLRQLNKGKKISDEQKEKLRHARMGSKMSDSHKEILKQYARCPKRIAKISAASKNKSHETLLKHSISMKKRWQEKKAGGFSTSDETREKIREARKNQSCPRTGRKHSQETKDRIRQTNILKGINPQKYKTI